MTLRSRLARYREERRERAVVRMIEEKRKLDSMPMMRDRHPFDYFNLDESPASSFGKDDPLPVLEKQPVIKSPPPTPVPSPSRSPSFSSIIALKSRCDYDEECECRPSFLAKVNKTIANTFEPALEGFKACACWRRPHQEPECKSPPPRFSFEFEKPDDISSVTASKLVGASDDKARTTAEVRDEKPSIRAPEARKNKPVQPPEIDQRCPLAWSIGDRKPVTVRREPSVKKPTLIPVDIIGDVGTWTIEFPDGGSLDRVVSRAGGARRFSQSSTCFETSERTLRRKRKMSNLFSGNPKVVLPVFAPAA